MTRVLHVLCDLSAGGAERLVLELCRRAPSSFEMEVATVHAGGALAPAYSAAGIPVRCAGRIRGHLGLRATLRLARWSRDFDIVHTHLWAGDAWGRLGARLAGHARLVSTEHNIDRDEGWAKARWKVLTSRGIESIAVSEAVATHWRRQGIRDPSVIRNGIDLAAFSAPHVGGGGVFFAGRLTHQKGVDVLIEAARRLPTIPFQIAGEGPERSTLAASAPANVTFLGRVEDIPTRLAHADVLVVPSRWEGFGLIAAEGLAAGVPVIATRVDGLIEVVGHHGTLIEPDNPSALTNAIQQVLGSAHAPQESGRQHAATFSIEAMCDAYWAVYQRLSTRTRSC